MAILSIGLIVLGLASALAGYKLFRLLLPVVGLVSGAMVGFTGMHAVFGTGVVSTAVAVVVAVIAGVLFALLSYVFFDIALVVLSAVVGAAAVSFLGVALGLGENGFIMLMLNLAGIVLGLVFATNRNITPGFVMALTALWGAAAVLVGIMLAAGEVTLTQLDEEGIIRTLLTEVEQSFLWFVAWVGSGLIALQVQRASHIHQLLGDSYEYGSNK